MPEVTAVLVTYNRKQLLKESLQALMKLREKTPVRILVVDNASTDGTGELLAPLAKAGDISYLNTGANLGGAGGFHTAIREAMKENPDYVWLMDDDTVVTADALEKLLEQASLHPEASFFSSKALWIDGTVNQMNTQRLLEKEEGRKAVLCREATFVSLLVRAEAIRSFGLPIKEFFIWGDDIEYTRRLSFRQPGYYVPDSVVVHKTANNAGSNIAIDAPERMNRYRYAYRNEVYIANEEGLYRKARQLAKILFHSARVLAISKDHKREKIKLIWSASREGLSFHPEIEYIDQRREERA